MSSNTIKPGTSSLHVFALSGFCIAQPLYDLFSRQAEFFVARNAGLLDLVILVFALSIAIPAAISTLLFIFYRHFRTLYRPACLVAIGFLVALLVLIALKQLKILSGYAALAFTLSVSALLLAGYLKLVPLQRLLTLLAPAGLLFPALFLLSPNTLDAISWRLQDDGMHASGGTHTPGKKANTPVIVVVFDELALYALLNKFGTIDATLYPNFNRLATSSSWYRNATTVVPVTNFAVPAIISGRYPDVEALPVDTHYPQSLFTLLAPTHTLTAMESVTRLCPAKLCLKEQQFGRPTGPANLLQDVAIVYAHIVVPSSFSNHLPPLGNRWGGFGTDDTKLGIKEEYLRQETRIRDAIKSSFKEDRLRQFDHFVSNLENWSSGTPPLYFLHMLFPHTPWKYYPSGKVYTLKTDHRPPGMDRENILWTENKGLAELGYRRYLMQVALLDKLLGKLLDKLDKTGLFDQSLIVITSDHGASFIPGQGFRKLTPENYKYILPVPLFIKYPGQTVGEIDDSNIELIDIFPTIANRLGLELTTAIPGHPIGSTVIQSRSGKRMYNFFSRWENNPVTVEDKLYTSFISTDLRAGESADIPGNTRSNITKPGRYIGQSLSAFSISNGGADIQVDQLSLFADIDLSGSHLPGLLTGQLPRNIDTTSAQLLIALNGTLQAQAVLYTEDSEHTAFTALLPERAFKQGENALRAFFTKQDDIQVTLVELAVH